MPFDKKAQNNELRLIIISIFVQTANLNRTATL